MSNLQSIVLGFFLVLTLCASSCKRDECLYPTGHTFSTKGIHFFPETDSLSLGDTLWVSFDEPDRFVIANGDSIDFANAANLGTYLKCSFFNEMGGLEYAIPYIDFILKKGIVFKDHSADFKLRSYLFDHIGGHYQLSVGMVLKKQGMYFISNSDASGVYKMDDPNYCTSSTFLLPISNTDKHIDLLIERTPDRVAELEQYKDHIYCFFVK